MTTQPEALRLADALDAHQFDEPHATAAELRRLSAVEAQRDALLEALKGLMQQYKDQPECFMDWSKARAAIKAMEGNQMTKKRFTVRIRRDIGRLVRPEAEQIDGKTYTFTYGWLMDEGDSYPGEQAWLPQDSTYPVDAPPWIASGDLEETK